MKIRKSTTSLAILASLAFAMPGMALAQKVIGTGNAAFVPQAERGACALTGTIAATPFSQAGDTEGGTNTVNNVPNGTTAPSLGICSEYLNAPGNARGPDHIYAFTAGTGANLTFTATGATGSFDPMLYILSTCGDSVSCVLGADDRPSTFAPSFNYTAFTPGQTYYVYVDSWYNVAASATLYAGPYTLAVTGTLPVQLSEFEID